MQRSALFVVSSAQDPEMSPTGAEVLSAFCPQRILDETESERKALVQPFAAGIREKLFVGIRLLLEEDTGVCQS
jgi:hypothetical protein